MCARTSFSITFMCRESKKTKQNLAALEMCININQKRLYINLPVKFNPKDFNKKRQPVEIQTIVNQYRVKINEIIGELMQQGKPVTVETLREYLKTGGTKTYTVSTLVDEYLQHLQTRLGTTLKKGVYEKYVLVAQFMKQEIGNKELCTITNGYADIEKV